MAPSSTSRVITAAGAVVLRGRTGSRRVLVEHRARYNDWSLPKGKSGPDEYLPVTAVREVGEETGYRIRLGSAITTTRYRIGLSPKRVSWWLGELVSTKQGKRDDEADRVEWWPIEKAITELTYPSDVEVLTSGLRRARCLPFLIVRHAKAMSRRSWRGPDPDRRLTERGRRQARALGGLLGAFGVQRLLSSTSIRCLTTFKPYASKSRLVIHPVEQLSEEYAEAHPDAVGRVMRQIITDALKTGQVTAVCGHRPVLPAMLSALGISYPVAMRPGEAMIAYLDPGSRLVAVDTIAPKL